MKKTAFLILLMALGIASFHSYGEESSPEEIRLRKNDYSGGPRVPPPGGYPELTALIWGDALLLQVENYTGDVQVQIIGAGATACSFYVSENGGETVDLTALPAGDYTLQIITAAGVYMGEFEL